MPTPPARQLAIVRTIADEVDRCAADGLAAVSLHEQLAQELARLGCGSLATAAAMCGIDPAWVAPWMDSQ
jgi:hypothetical protein